ncbi:MAG: hypothetical protein GXX96_24480 [Planctomycetaceae bacterium]|nr:hypothetical protein [Planctomycetaceae bacterium]
MRTLLLFSASIFLASCVFAAEESAPQGVTVTPQGLRIVKPAPPEQDKLRAFNWSPGTSVSLLVSAPQGGLIAVDSEASKLTMFLDDKRTDLRKEESGQQGFGPSSGFGMMPSISDDGKYCSIDVEAPRVPTAGATRVAVAGELALSVASQKKDFTAEGVALKKGTKVKAGQIPFTITAVGKPDWGDAPLAVTLEAKQELDAVADIQFFDASGTKIESERSSEGSMGFGEKVTVTQTYNLGKKVDSCDITVTYWADRKKLVVPFKLVLGLGF